MSRAVQLELTKTQTAEEFRRKLRLARRTSSKVMVSDNVSVFKSTATWMIKQQEERKVTGLPDQTGQTGDSTYPDPLGGEACMNV